MATFPPFPPFHLHDPCAQDPNNLIVNGSMGPANHITQYGTVVDGWEPFVLGQFTPQFQWVSNEAIDPGGSQQIFSSDAFDAGVYQVVKKLQPNAVYMVRLGYALAARSVNGSNIRVNTIGRRLGVDPQGGTDALSPNVIWGPPLFDGKAALNRPEMQMVFVAQAKRVTVFLRAMAQEGGKGENRVWFDAVCMEARPDISPADLATPPPPAQGQQPPIPPGSLEDAVLLRATAAKPWMPVNNTAALWQYAKAHGLQDQQSDELPFTWRGDNYICQVFNLGIVYVKVGDWGNIKHISKQAV